MARKNKNYSGRSALLSVLSLPSFAYWAGSVSNSGIDDTKNNDVSRGAYTSTSNSRAGRESITGLITNRSLDPSFLSTVGAAE